MKVSAGAHAHDCACCTPRATSRRRFLAGLGTIGAATMLPAPVVLGQGAKARLIDTHHHYYPPEYQKAWLEWEDKRKIPHFPTQLGWTRERAVERTTASLEAIGAR